MVGGSGSEFRLTRRQLSAGLLSTGTLGLALQSATLRAAARRGLAPFATRLAAVDAVIADVMQAAGYPGMVVAIEMGGETEVKGYGLADVEAGRSVTADTAMPIGSVTKSFTALAVMQLAVAGKLDLDAPISRYLDEYRGPARDVVLHRLLNHTSGIPNYTSDPDFPKDLQRRFTQADVIGVIAGKPLLFVPGTRFSYSNSNTYLLGMVTERVSGMTYSDYLDAHVFGPFGMTHTRVADFRALIPQRAAGYALDGGKLRNADHYDVNYPGAAGAIISTAEDMLRYRRGVFGIATSPAVRERLIAHPPLADGTPLFYTLGCLVSSTFEGRRRYSHAGDIAGFGSHYAWYPDDDLTVVVLTNLEHGIIPPYAISRKISRTMLGVQQPAISDLAVSPTLLQRLTGDYDVRPIEFGVPRYGFTALDGRLAMTFGGVDAPGPRIPLLYQGRNRFVTQFDTEFSFEFVGSGKALTAEFYDGTFTAFRAA